MVGKEVQGSLAVANVQQLASSIKEVPTRYIRPELEFDLVSNDKHDQIPVIDMSKLVGGCDDHVNELIKLHLACRDWGFFQVINHDIAKEVIMKIKTDVQEFFNQPLQEKMEYAQPPNDLQGYGQAFVLSEEQKLDWGDMLFLLAQPTKLRNLKFWPKNPSSFRESLDQYSTELENLTRNLLSCMARNLGLEPEKLLSLFEEGAQAVRMNYYPPCEQASKVIGLAPHADGDGLTLLTQVNEVQGLQIKKDGKWILVEPIPDAFIVNIGDLIEVISNGEYKSIEHRAVVNPKKERLSIAAFHSPSLEAIIEPLPDLLMKDQKQQAPKYKSILHSDLIMLGEKTKLDGKEKGIIHHMKIQTEEQQ